MKVTATLNNLRIAPRKTKLAADFIKGLDLEKAVSQLDSTVKKACPSIKKLLESAAANGENNFGLSKDNLYVYDVIVNAGPTLKRWMPKAYGRAGQILKRTSNIIVVLEERVEGKDRKSKEELEKERKKREEARKKEEKEMKEKEGEAKKEEKGEKITKENNQDKVKKGSGQKSWTNKIFRRKSM